VGRTDRRTDVTIAQRSLIEGGPYNECGKQRVNSSRVFFVLHVTMSRTVFYLLCVLCISILGTCMLSVDPLCPVIFIVKPQYNTIQYNTVHRERLTNTDAVVIRSPSPRLHTLSTRRTTELVAFSTQQRADCAVHRRTNGARTRAEETVSQRR